MTSRYRNVCSTNRAARSTVHGGQDGTMCAEPLDALSVMAAEPPAPSSHQDLWIDEFQANSDQRFPARCSMSLV